jgi:hypothetical protein
MNPKRIIIVSTMAIVITISAGLSSENASANTSTVPFGKSGDYNKIKEISSPTTNANTTKKEDLTQVLGLTSNQELYDALYSGNSLAAIAEKNNVAIQNVIDLQVAEMTAQLDSRLASGSISPITYLLQKLELPDIVSKSIHVKMDR